MKIKNLLTVIVILIITITMGCSPGSIRESKKAAENKREEILNQKQEQSSDPRRPNINRDIRSKDSDNNTVVNSDISYESKKSINIKPNNHKYECPDFAKEFLKNLKEIEEKKLPPTATRGDEWNAIFTLEYCPKDLAVWIDGQCIKMSYSLASETNINWVVLDSLISGNYVVTNPLFK